VFLDESGFRLTPTVRRTLALRGQTPALECWDWRDKISAISALTLTPKRHLRGLPGCAPERNPDGPAWRRVKSGRGRSRAAPGARAPRGSVGAGLGTPQERADELLGLLDRTGLSLAA
jgi:hypothetical protein